MHIFRPDVKKNGPDRKGKPPYEQCHSEKGSIKVALKLRSWHAQSGEREAPLVACWKAYNVAFGRNGSGASKRIYTIPFSMLLHSPRITPHRYRASNWTILHTISLPPQPEEWGYNEGGGSASTYRLVLSLYSTLCPHSLHRMCSPLLMPALAPHSAHI